MTNNRLKLLVLVLCCALCISMLISCKASYISDSKTEHLGKITYRLPSDCEWVYGDFVCDTKDIEYPGKNGIIAVDGKDGKVLAKDYVDMKTLTNVRVEYNMLGEKPNEDYVVGWDKQHGESPKTVQRLVIETDEGPNADGEWFAGSYWKAFMTIDDTEYVVTVQSLHDADLSEIGEKLISTVATDESFTDEYEK